MKFGKENGRYNMCIAIPGKMTAIVDENIGYAISEISEEESEETMRLLKIMAGLEEIDSFENESQ
ncbi:hypothetical protein [Methanosarcina mazei]|nr:hypothetical protein [Methanosarcina mazei]